MTETITDAAAEGVTREDLVVVHTQDGKLIKGYLRWWTASADLGSLPPLLDTLQIRHNTEAGASNIDLADVKAVFFVKTPEGNVEYSEVKFFADATVPDLWVKVQLADGESLEGRVGNSIRLLVEPGFWLRPADFVANNMMVYVPKSSVVFFHVMGFAAARSETSRQACTTAVTD